MVPCTVYCALCTPDSQCTMLTSEYADQNAWKVNRKTLVTSACNKAYNKKQSNVVKSKLLLVLMATKPSQLDDYDSVACLVATPKICSSERESVISQTLQTSRLKVHIYRHQLPWTAKTSIRMPCDQVANKVAALQLSIGYLSPKVCPQEISSLCDMHLLQTQCNFHMCSNKRAPIHADERPTEMRSSTQAHTHTHSQTRTQARTHTHAHTHTQHPWSACKAICGSVQVQLLRCVQD